MKPFRWCELGCGPGANLIINAATNPSGHFIGIDFNPEHIEQGRKKAAMAGLANLEFIECDFDKADGIASRNPFDFIVLHGLWSWIAPETRRSILVFIRRWLRPCGVLYLHHMTHPGMSSFAAGQHLLRRKGMQAGGPRPEQARSGRDFLAQLAQAGAGYFVIHPAEVTRLENARHLTDGHLTHEFMNPHWEPLHVADVMDELAGIGCRRLGSAVPIDNIDAASLPAGVLPLLADQDDPGTREALKDLARNQTERRDLYAMGGEPLTAAEHRALLWEQPFVRLPGAPVLGGLTFDTRIGPVEGEAAVFDPVLRALADGPRTIGMLAQHRAFAAAPGILNQALQMLSWAGCVHPLSSTRPPREASWALNRILAHEALKAGLPGHLAAPALGSGVPADLLGMAGALAILDAPASCEEETGQRMLRLLGKHGHRGAAELGQGCAAWQRNVLPLWRQFGALPPASVGL
ncbi:class I SAM-dependent methyltransferase [Roseomonas xinghualingensis]|uniref:class I SAM-dependent methyltransferase n=1 Tax=Roseomonas xinghualingensis TaxID=2986475 RepID=UPI0021F1BD0F|nr:class I SAM-dependent methyltransferase [Roseomonas sp. SXEYE001]MCV4207180.1 class I SAM-dependent methyltransferase [Roseomonas sp. SXEYE001]